MNRQFVATLETRTSKKGTQYEVLVIKLCDGLEKLVFLEQAELALLKLQSSNNNVVNNNLPFEQVNEMFK